jgi:hypothetical protein
MKLEAWIFGSTAIFLVAVTPAYWFITSAGDTGADWTGTSALVMTTLLCLMVTAYLGFHAKRMDERPEDRHDGEIAEGAGELGFFPPYSWWPFWCGAALALITLSVALLAWWLVIVGVALGTMALFGWIFEYYRGIHAH